jgi:hypothetical protein
MIRHVLLKGTTGKVRMETFKGREHFVVPVVGLKEGVVWPVNSGEPEYVTRQAMAKAPDGWNGRPVFVDHPPEDGEQLSSNTPRLLERLQFGYLFNSKFNEDQIEFEAWLDPLLAQDVGEEAVRIIERLVAGEVVEVSVGAIVVCERRSGKFKGQEYVLVWKEITQDHLAMLPEGMEGACSVAMGCGAQRHASAHIIKDNVLMREEEVQEVPNTAVDKSIYMQLKSFLTTMRGSKIELSDQDLRTALRMILEKNDPGFAGIVSVFPTEKSVVYESLSDGNFSMFRRGYDMGEDGKLSLSEGREEVRSEVTYVAASAAPSAPPCGCHSQKEGSMTKAAALAALIASGQFQESDRPVLEKIDEAHLVTMAGSKKQPGVEEVQPGAPKPSPAQTNPQQPAQTMPSPDNPKPGQNPAPKTLASFLSELPDDAREVVQDGLRLRNEKKTSIIAAIKQNSRNPYTDDDLNSMSIAALEKMAALAGAEVNYAGQAIPREMASADQTGPRTVPQPLDMIARLKTAAAATTKH